MTGPASKVSPNWLLRSLIVLSVGIHAVVFLHVSDIYRSSTLSLIELTLQDASKPAARHIPRPRPRPKAPQPRDPVKRLNVVHRPLPRFTPLAIAPAEKNLPDTLMEGISAPEIPQAPSADMADWVPGPQVDEAAGEFMTAASYLDMVRLRIESRKHYPGSAKARSIEGRVTIRFILTPNGGIRDVTVTKGSRSKALNMAALDAVQNAAPFPRPPSSLFKGNLPLELTIVFELT